MGNSRKILMRRMCCAAPHVEDTVSSSSSSKKLTGNFRDVIEGKYVPLRNQRLFIIGQDLETVQEFLENVVPNPSGTTSYTQISNSECSLHGLETMVDYGAGKIDATKQMALVPESILVLGVCIKDALEDIVMQRCDASIDRLGDWIRSVKRPVFLRIGYEFDGPWNNYDPELYKLAFKWIVSRLRFRGVENFVSVWQSATYGSFDSDGRRQVDRSFVSWYPGNDVVDWMGTSYFHFDKRVHDAFLDFARSKRKPVMIAESAPQCYDLEHGIRVDHYTNQCLTTGLTGKVIWSKWFKPFFKYINDNKDVIRAVAYINTPWKKQTMWSSGVNGFWGDSRIQMNPYVKECFMKEILDSRRWLLCSTEFKSKINCGL